MEADDFAAAGFMVGEMDSSAGNNIVELFVGLSRRPQVIAPAERPPDMGLRQEIVIKRPEILSKK